MLAHSVKTLDEFALINHYFNFPLQSSSAVSVSIGDDAAVIDIHQILSELDVPSSAKLVVASDSLLESVHFPENFGAANVASRSLAVNISDFSAMGVRPRWMTLALSLPNVEETWVKAFSEKLKLELAQNNIALIGGDTTRGPLSITMTLFGVTNEGEGLQKGFLTRSGATVEDDLWVTGALARGRAGLQVMTEELGHKNQSAAAKRLAQHFCSPNNRQEIAIELLAFANSAIDISDGLIADAGHIAHKSAVKVIIDAARLPICSDVKSLYQKSSLAWALTGGDEYELLFTAHKARRIQLEAVAERLRIPLTRIGHVESVAYGKSSNENVEVCNLPSGISIDGGYKHF